MMILALTARDVMQWRVHTVGPRMLLAELDQEFIEKRVSGFPVVDDGKLVGIISRSDVVRQLGCEQQLAEMTSDFYWDHDGFHEVPSESIQQIATRIGQQIEDLRVEDLMVRHLVVVTADEAIDVVAQKLLENHIHRIPVVEQGRLIGIISTLDLVRLFANKRAQIVH